MSYTRRKRQIKNRTKKSHSTKIKKVSTKLFKKYVNMSPFELKNILITMAKEKGIEGISSMKKADLIDALS